MSFEHDMNADAQILPNETDATDALEQEIEAGELGADAETTGAPFSALGLQDALLRALKDAGYENATEVQAQAIPAALQGGAHPGPRFRVEFRHGVQDMGAQTGSGFG